MKNDLAGEWEIIADYRYEYGKWRLENVYEPDTRTVFITSGSNGVGKIKIDGTKYTDVFVGVHCAVLRSLDREWQIELKRCNNF